jgi:PAS domain S-box-containing protein
MSEIKEESQQNKFAYKVNNIKIIHLEDDILDAELILSKIESAGYIVDYTRVETGKEFEFQLENNKFDVILSDFSLPTFDGITALKICEEKYPYIPFILVTGTLGEEIAINMLNCGASDYILKANLNRLIPAIEHAITETAFKQQKIKAEEYLREREILLTSFFESPGACRGIVEIVNNDVFHIAVNKSSKEFFGFTKEEMENKFSSELGLERELIDRWISQYNESQKTGHPVYFEYFDESKQRWLSSIISYLKEEIRSHPRFTYTLRDITEHKNAQERLADSEKRFRNLYTNMAEGVCLHKLVFDEDGKPVNYKIVEVNKQYEQILNIKKEDIINKLATEAYGVNSPPYFDKYLKVVKGEKIYTFETYFPPKDKHFIISVSPWDNDGFATIFTDITKIKKAEEELIKAKEKAEELSRLKSNFLANMSHELRTPMVAILGFAELLSERLTDPEEKEMAETINKGGRRLTNTLNLILELSRVEASKTEVNINPVNISDTTNSIVKLYKQAAVKKNLKLLSYLNPEVIALVDISMFEKIVDNLLQNAIKYTNNGEVKVITGYEKTNKDEYTFIIVQDTGIGIPEKMLELIFEPFRQVSEGRSRHYEGMGLGLSITKKYTDLMNGYITVESKLGKGSKFKVMFPSSRMKMEKENKEKIIENILNVPFAPDESKNATVLVVEDDEMSVDMIKIVIKDFCEYNIVSSGEKALKKVREKKYSIILMDIGLRGMSGLEAVKKIRKISGYENTPMIAVTAYAMEGDKEKFLKGGCTDYISKPFKIKDFQELIKKYLFSSNHKSL